VARARGFGLLGGPGVRSFGAALGRLAALRLLAFVPRPPVAWLRLAAAIAAAVSLPEVT